MTTVHLTPVTPAGTALVLELNGDVELGGGVGGWDDVARQRRESTVSYTGTPARTLAIPVLVTGIDRPTYRTVNVGGAGGAAGAFGVTRTRRVATGHRSNVSIEPTLARLETFGRRTATTSEPPILKVSGPVPAAAGRQWVLADLEWGAYDLLKTGARCRQEAVVHLTEYLPAAALVTKASGASKSEKALYTHVLKADLPVGLPRVAARVLHDRSKWPQIAKLNKDRHGKTIRDPADVFVGQRLRYK